MEPRASARSRCYATTIQDLDRLMDDQFARLPAWVFGRVKLASIGLLGAMAKDANYSTWVVEISDRSLARKTGSKAETIARYIADLESVGAISVITREPGRTPVYQINHKPPPESGHPHNRGTPQIGSVPPPESGRGAPQIGSVPPPESGHITETEFLQKKQKPERPDDCGSEGKPQQPPLPSDTPPREPDPPPADQSPSPKASEPVPYRLTWTGAGADRLAEALGLPRDQIADLHAFIRNGAEGFYASLVADLRRLVRLWRDPDKALRGRALAAIQAIREDRPVDDRTALREGGCEYDPSRAATRDQIRGILQSLDLRPRSNLDGRSAS